MLQWNMLLDESGEWERIITHEKEKMKWQLSYVRLYFFVLLSQLVLIVLIIFCLIIDSKLKKQKANPNLWVPWFHYFIIEWVFTYQDNDIYEI